MTAISGSVKEILPRSMISAASAAVILLFQTSAMANDASDLVAGYSYATTCAFIDAAWQISLDFLKKDNDRSHSMRAGEPSLNIYRYSSGNVSILYLDQSENMHVLQAVLPLEALTAEMKSNIADVDQAKKYFQVKDAAKTEGMTSFSCDDRHLIVEYANKRTKTIKIIADSGAD